MVSLKHTGPNIYSHRALPTLCIRLLSRIGRFQLATFTTLKTELDCIRESHVYGGN